MRGQQTCPLYNMYLYHVNSKVGRQHTKVSLEAVIGSFMALPTHPSHYVNDVATPPGSKSPSLLERWCGFFYVPQEQISVSATIFGPYPRRLESLTVCRCHYKGSTFFSVILRPLVLARPWFEPVTSPSEDRRSPKWANHVLNKL